MRKHRPKSLTDDLLNIHETAALLGRCPSTVYQWAELGLIPAPIEYGRQFRWRRSDLVAWVDAGCPKREPDQKESKAKS